jgi:1,4-alpha-glucan branching enzyme
VTGPPARGRLCLVLHAHMPYVEGHGTWPFGEEWLWEAVATVYLPLLRVIDQAPVTLGLTPVLCDQLETLTGEAGERVASFLTGVRAQIHAEDADGLERAGYPDLAAELRRAAGDYERAERDLGGLGGDLVGAFRALAERGAVELWAGPATHAILPLLATGAGLHLQLASGCASHERRFGRHAEGMWLPECAYEPGLERDLADHGVRVFCVDQTDAMGLGSPDQLEPVATGAGPVAVPIDWSQVALVWDERSGYPAARAYRNTYRRTTHDLMPWDNADGTYDHAAADDQAHAHALDFVERAILRLDAYGAERGRPGVLCCALDAELLGHWWYEGPRWLEHVLELAAARGLELATLSGALEDVEPVHRPLRSATWGKPKDLSTWDSPEVAGLAFGMRAAELELVAAATALARQATGRRAAGHAALERAARELLALQSSDWAFMTARRTAGDYPALRAGGHRAGLDAALAALKDSALDAPAPEMRNLAPDLDLSPLIAP